jgi:hypothetical protein
LIPISNQDGRQAQNRKRGDEILIVYCCFRKGAIQESFQQSLVEIGSVVSEKKIFF